MHSRIFQITKERMPENEWISADDYYDHWFTREIADYVDDDVDRESDIEWLLNCYDGVFERNGNQIKVVNKIKYFEKKYDEFIRLLNELKYMPIEAFAGNETEKCQTSYKMYSLESAYNEKFGFYVDDCGEWAGLDTFDSFMRTTENGNVYYVGGVVDYHW